MPQRRRGERFVCLFGRNRSSCTSKLLLGTGHTPRYARNYEPEGPLQDSPGQDRRCRQGNPARRRPSASASETISPPARRGYRAPPPGWTCAVAPHPPILYPFAPRVHLLLNNSSPRCLPSQSNPEANTPGRG